MARCPSDSVHTAVPLARRNSRSINVQWQLLSSTKSNDLGADTARTLPHLLHAEHGYSPAADVRARVRIDTRRMATKPANQAKHAASASMKK